MRRVRQTRIYRFDHRRMSRSLPFEVLCKGGRYHAFSSSLSDLWPRREGPLETLFSLLRRLGRYDGAPFFLDNLNCGMFLPFGSSFIPYHDNNGCSFHHYLLPLFFCSWTLFRSSYCGTDISLTACLFGDGLWMID